MNLEELIQNQAAYVKQQYADFEALKRVWERESGDSNAFSSFAAAPKAKRKSKAPESSFQEQGYEDAQAPSGAVNAWKSYMDKYASGEAFELHDEAFPPSLVECEEDIDPDSMSYGVPMGIPKNVWVHLENAGRMLADIGEST